MTPSLLTYWWKDTNTVCNDWVAAIYFEPNFGEFGVPLTVGPYLVGGSTFSIPINDIDDGSCATFVSFTPPQPCSNGGSNLPELNASINAGPPKQSLQAIRAILFSP